MDSANSPTQTVQASGQKQLGPRSLMLTLHVYDVSSVQERLLYGTAFITNTAETIDDTVPASTKLNLLENQIIDLDLIMGASSCLRSRL